MSDPVLIVAGDHREAEFHAKAHGLTPREWVYVGGSIDLLGRRGNKIAFVGTSWRSPIFNEFPDEAFVVKLYSLERLEWAP